MKKHGILFVAICAMLCACLLLTSCAAGGEYAGHYPNMPNAPGEITDNACTDGDWPDNNYQYDQVFESAFIDVATAKSSYFSLDKNTAGYAYMRRQINNKRVVEPTSIRVEELINYFDYDYPAPEGEDPVRVSTYLSECPWNDANKVLTVGIKTRQIRTETLKNNFVFLVDVSGSMYGSDRIGLVKYGLNKLVDNLTENDRISIVTYASGVELKLESTLLTEKGKRDAKAVIDSLQAQGSTNGSGGLQMAYEIAERQKSDDVNSRIILMSDGDFNVGIYNTEQLKGIISDHAKSGVYLSVLGYGMGNTRDDMLEMLARNGNGNYAYIDSEIEAEKVLCDELNGMLVTVMKDVKAGVTFSEDTVRKYRLIGYDTKILTEDEFNDPDKDAGEIGSNLTVTAMYEIELNEGVEENADIASVEIRFKDVAHEEKDSSVIQNVVMRYSDADNVRFALCVAEFGLILRDSKYKGTASLSVLLERLSSLESYTKADVYKAEFARIVAAASEYEFYPRRKSF